jgi:hypothetical protein
MHAHAHAQGFYFSANPIHWVGGEGGYTEPKIRPGTAVLNLVLSHRDISSTRRYVYSSTLHTAHGTYIYLVLVTHVHTGTTTKFSTNYRIH